MPACNGAQTAGTSHTAPGQVHWQALQRSLEGAHWESYIVVAAGVVTNCGPDDPAQAHVGQLGNCALPIQD